MSKLFFTKQNSFKGAIVYAIGDTIATLLLGQFNIYRLIGITLIGATVYAFEVPNMFAWIERNTNKEQKYYSLRKTLWAILYFNPLWISRHILFLKLLSGQTISTAILILGLKSFLVNIPVVFLANYIIQNKIKDEWRFLASATFSASLAIYYALSETIFN